MIQVNLSCSYENLHFTRDKIDIDIRHGLPNWTGVEIRTIRNEKLEVLASLSYWNVVLCINLKIY